MTQARFTAPTDRQLILLGKLLDEAETLLHAKDRATGRDIAETVIGEYVTPLRNITDVDRKEISQRIGSAIRNNRLLRQELKALDYEPEDSSGNTQVPVTFVGTGVYRVGDRIFKVLPSRNSDRHFAKELTGFHWDDKIPVADENAHFAFTYAPGAMLLIREEHRMTDKQARAFGRITGHCIVCGKLLTDPASIEAGIGPVCAGKR